MHSAFKRVLIQLGLWTLAFAVLFTYRWSYAYQWFPSKVFIPLIDMSVLFLSALCINRLLVPKLLYRQRTGWFAFSLVGLLLLSGQAIHWLQTAWFTFVSPGNDPYLETLKSFIFQVFNVYLVSFFGCLCILSLRLMNDHRAAQRRFETLQKENAQTELKFLKAQINPHFLFNSINSIYAGIDKGNTAAREQVLAFSDMLRYQLYECATDVIPVEKELEYLHNYISFQRMRKEESLQLDLTLEGHLAGFDLAPLLFIPFIENAFKYVSNHDNKPNRLQIKLTRQDDELVFYCFNTKDTVRSRPLFEEGGIGINNVKRRLELLYPDKHELHITDSDAGFEVKLHLVLTTLSPFGRLKAGSSG